MHVMYTCACVYAYMRVCRYACINVYMHVRKYANTYVCKYIRTRIYVCTRARGMHTCVYAYKRAVGTGSVHLCNYLIITQLSTIRNTNADSINGTRNHA